MEDFLNAVLAYFVIVDPIGMSLIFNALTTGRSRGYVRIMAFRSIGVSMGLVLVFGLWGAGLLKILGIQMDSFRIAGGLLIFYSAFGMITKPDTPPDRETAAEEQIDISVFPLSIPLMAGPGCLTLTVLLFSKARESGASMMPLVAAIAAIYVTTLMALVFSGPMVRLLGNTANHVFKRLLGVLLASLAIQFIADGIRGLS